MDTPNRGTNDSAIRVHLKRHVLDRATWADVLTPLRFVPLFAGIGGFLGLIPTGSVWIWQGFVDPQSLAFFCKVGAMSGAITGLALWLWWMWDLAAAYLATRHVAIDERAFFQAGYDLFRTWVLDGGLRDMDPAQEGLDPAPEGELLFGVHWHLEGGHAQARFHPKLESVSHTQPGMVRVEGDIHTQLWEPTYVRRVSDRNKVPHIVIADVVPPRQRWLATHLPRSGVEVRVGPFRMDSAHAVLALTHLAGAATEVDPDGRIHVLDTTATA